MASLQHENKRNLPAPIPQSHGSTVFVLSLPLPPTPWVVFLRLGSRTGWGTNRNVYLTSTYNDRYCRVLIYIYKYFLLAVGFSNAAAKPSLSSRRKVSLYMFQGGNSQPGRLEECLWTRGNNYPWQVDTNLGISWEHGRDILDTIQEAWSNHQIMMTAKSYVDCHQTKPGYGYEIQPPHEHDASPPL